MIKVEGVSKQFKGFVALNNVSCNIQDGCIYGVVGSNGAGKSTFLRVLSGVYKVHSGAVTIDEELVYENPKVKKRIVYVSDKPYALPGATARRMARHYSLLFDKFDMAQFKELMAMFKLDSKKRINDLSKGMRQQIAIILALCTRAEYMFFDESFDGLDAVVRELVKKLICSEVAQHNTTVIVTSHSLRELDDFCDHMLLLHRGGVVLNGDINDLKAAQYKVRIAFGDEFDRKRFEGFDIISYHQEGRIANMVIKGPVESFIQKLRMTNPVLMNVAPLSLEEVSASELEELGYNFDEALEVDCNE